jgi:hypothetical protein
MRIVLLIAVVVGIPGILGCEKTIKEASRRVVTVVA